MENEFGKPLTHYLKLVKRRLALFSVITAIGVLVGAVVLVLLPSRHVAEAVMVLDIGSFTEELGRRPEPVAGERPGAESRLLAVQQSALSDTRLLEAAASGGWLPPDAADLPERRRIDAIRAGIEIEPIYEGPHRIIGDPGKLAFAVRFTHDDPVVAQAGAAWIVNALRTADRQMRVAKLDDEVALVEREYDQIRGNLAAIDAELSRLSRENIESLPERLEANLSEMERRSEQLQTVETEINEIENQRKLLQYEFSVRREALLSPAEEERLRALKTELGELLLNASESHPQVQALKRQIAVVENRLQVATDTAPAASDDGQQVRAAPEVRMLAEQGRVAEERRTYLIGLREEISARLAVLRENVERTPEVQSMITDTEGRRAAVQRLLDQVTDRLNESRLRARIEADAKSDRFAVVVEPAVLDYPAGPSMRVLGLGVLIAAAGGAGLLILGLDFADGTIRETYDMRVLGDVPVVAIPDVHRRSSGWGAAAVVVLALAVVGASATAVIFKKDVRGHLIAAIGKLEPSSERAPDASRAG